MTTTAVKSPHENAALETYYDEARECWINRYRGDRFDLGVYLQRYDAIGDGQRAAHAHGVPHIIIERDE